MATKHQTRLGYGLVDIWSKHWYRETNGRLLGIFRLVFGALMCIAMLRYLLNDWVTLFFEDTLFHFSYAGFSWVPVLAAPGMTALVVCTGVAALCLSIGFYTTVAATCFFIGFTWIELCDVSYYLNHYYLVSLLAGILIITPSGSKLSVDAYRRRQAGKPRAVVYQGHYTLLKLQISIVYLCAGLAKIHADWLIDGLPLGLWLARYEHLPLIGPLLANKSTAICASWAGMLYDCSIPFLLWWKRSRPIALLAVAVFHLCTAALFPIGLFPWIMMAAALLFCEPAQSHTASPSPTLQGNSKKIGPVIWPVVALLFLGLQMLWPFRYLLHAGDVRWHEQGFRFAWRVMLMEKTGDVHFRVVHQSDGREEIIDPSCYLKPHQLKQLETQPDLIKQFAHFLAAEADTEVAVYAESWASLNGRSPQQLVNPTVDLTTVPAIGWNRERYVLPFAP